jgi:hypothetical protein
MIEYSKKRGCPPIIRSNLIGEHKLMCTVVGVSVRTMEIVKSLPPLE